MADAAGDRCPYSRPFPPDFDACPAYHRAEYIPVDSRLGALRRVLTCAHLQVKPGPRDGCFYGSCRLGDAASRVLWVNAARIERIPLTAVAEQNRTPKRVEPVPLTAAAE